MDLLFEHNTNPRGQLPQVEVTNLGIHEVLKDVDQCDRFRLRDHQLFQLLAQCQCGTGMPAPELSDKLAKSKRVIRFVI